MYFLLTEEITNPETNEVIYHKDLIINIPQAQRLATEHRIYNFAAIVCRNADTAIDLQIQLY